MSLSIWQLLIVLALVVLFFGKKRLPALGQSMKSFLTEFKKGKEGRSDIDITRK